MISHFCRHPDFYLKNLFPVNAIYVSSAPYPYQDYDCFWIHRDDGSVIDISYNKAVFAEDTQMQRFLKAVRLALKPNFEDFIE